MEWSGHAVKKNFVISYKAPLSSNYQFCSIDNYVERKRASAVFIVYSWYNSKEISDVEFKLIFSLIIFALQWHLDHLVKPDEWMVGIADLHLFYCSVCTMHCVTCSVVFSFLPGAS